MRCILKLIFTAAAITAMHTAEAGPVAIAIHGGAGTIEKSSMEPEREAEIHAVLEEAVNTGHGILEDGGTSLDAVVAAIRVLEESPHFNAARGAVLTEQGKVEMDASVMRGDTLDAGAVAGISGVRSPVTAARQVMENSPHVMLAGEGAEAFARQQGLEFMDPEWFITDFRKQQLEEIRREGAARTSRRESWFSTVGAVALDTDGNLAAATSTGGTANKRWGRIGDSPIIGAGTYADNRSCAVSATGHGEYFIRHVVAYDICARTAYTGRNVQTTADQVVNGVLKNAGGSGGVIAMDRYGRITMPFNTPGMYRAAIHTDGRREVALYRNPGDDTPEGH